MRSCAAASSTTSASPTPRRSPAIVEVHFPDLKPRLPPRPRSRPSSSLREAPGLKKRPSTSELLDWIRLLVGGGTSIPRCFAEKAPGKVLPPLYGALLKNEQDVHLFERLAFLDRGAPLMRRLPSFMRHAKAERVPGKSDFDRALVERGRNEGPTGWRPTSPAAGVRPDRILCSSSRRTRETLALVLPHLAADCVAELRRDLYDADARQTLWRVLIIPGRKVACVPR